jgi:hypothetical protein
MDYRIALGIIASVIGTVSYLPYFINIFKGKTKPHVFSWFVWGLLTGIAFFAQMAKGAGAGAWVTGLTAFFCLIIAMIALFRGEKGVTKSDWFCFIGALCGLLLWKLTSNPLLAVLLVTTTDALAFTPTFRKAYFKPYEETVSTFALNTIKFIFGLIALQSFNLTTWLYPASLVLMNGWFVIMVLLRRKSIKA